MDPLEELRRGGRHDSTGRFRLDPRRAAERLAGDVLEDPAAYCLKLVQWAVAGGAAGLDVRVGARSLALEHDAAALTRPDAEGLLDSLLCPAAGPRRHLVRLASGAAAALALGAEGVVVESWGRNWGVRLRLAPDGAAIDTPDGRAPARPWNRITVVGRPGRRGHGVLAHGLERLRGAVATDGGRPEAQRMRDACRYAAIPIRLNGAFLNRPHDRPVDGTQHQLVGPEAYSSRTPFGTVRLGYKGEPSHACSRYVVAEHFAPNLLAGPAFDPRVMKRVGIQPSLDLRNAQLPAMFYRDHWLVACHMMVEDTEGSNGSEVVLVQDGVAVQRREAPADFFEGVRAIVAANELATDLSGFRVVEDAGYRELLERLKACLTDGRPDLVDARRAKETAAPGVVRLLRDRLGPRWEFHYELDRPLRPEEHELRDQRRAVFGDCDDRWPPPPWPPT